MLKKPLITATSLCLCLLLAPALAQAAPWKLAPRSEATPAVTRLLSILETWWSGLFGGEERRGDTAIQEKNGCGIDPNGQPLCGDGGPGTGAGTNEDPGTVGGGTGG
ncbi:MAG TPA: hypothetical protein VE685_22380 [Thermoanaerobaculia bacterium]|nr:hypothetical protein [Thermoanaerobaculia bacterium]